ncbi:MAG: hypothetical protein M3096_09325 [Actinomycetia bacterium]|nr:hypothetical protein [Actinomycetes bacterium]
MRMRQQLIIVVAVVFATVAVGVNVFAATRAADQHARQLEQTMPVASILDHGVFETPPLADPPDDSAPPTNSDAPNNPCGSSDTCRDNNGNAYGLAFSNHGREISAFVAHIGFVVGEDGPRGGIVSGEARPDIEADGPPRSDRAEERSSNDNAPPGQAKDDPDEEGSDDDSEDSDDDDDDKDSKDKDD